MIVASVLFGLSVLTAPPQQAEYTSPLGTTHYARAMRSELLAEMEAKLEAADTAEELLEVGNEFATYRLYRRAIAIYSRAIELRPDWAALYRDRGHRRISLRDFGGAIQDLQQGARLDNDSLEIHLHLALAYYFTGDFSAARDSLERCLELAETEDERVGASYWLYLTLKRLGDDAGARELLDGFHAGSRVDQSAPLLELLLFHKGLVKEADLLTDETAGIQLATYGYGVACRYLFEGKEQEAHELLRRIVRLRFWPAFGFIAAEMELIRSGE